MSKKLRFIISIVIILLTIAEFTYYLSRHSYLLKQLAHTQLSTILWLLLLYSVMLGVLALILQATLAICKLNIKLKDNLLLNAYSLFVNFFIIGQAGPGVRAVYLKKHYKLLIRKYIFVTLLYYAGYAVISTGLVLAGSSVPWWLMIISALAVVGVCILVVKLYTSRSKFKSGSLNLSLNSLFKLFLIILLQAVLQIVIYMIELHSVNSHITLRQTITYTGVANLALFVGLTPGAIGIRESFLVLSEKLHHISSANIISANLIDRSVYLVFLGILFVATISFHIQDRFSSKDTVDPIAPTD
jgi:uncharacterized membrane protein YbhN (UPF0104 family)